MLIVITGTPGTGKTEMAKKLAKITNMRLIQITTFVNKRKLYSLTAGEKVVDTAKLEKVLKKELKNESGTIIEGHLACEIMLPADFIFVLRTHPKILEKRLDRRGYSQEKIAKNLLAEMLDYCVVRSEKNYKNNVLEVNTTKRNRHGCARIVLGAIRKKSKKIDSVNYKNELINYVSSLSNIPIK